MTSEDSSSGITLYTVALIQAFQCKRNTDWKKNPASMIWLKSGEMLEFTPLLSCMLAIAFMLLICVDWHSLCIVNVRITPGIFSQHFWMF